MQTTRRNLFKFLGGSAVGVMFTPAPWRLLTDTALWSENWPGIPRPARGEIKTKYTNCALCPAGCAVRARLVGEQPVALMGVPSHPLSRGALCPFGLTGHHLPYHPERLKQGLIKEAADAVANAIAQCGPDERIAVLDLRPGRTASWTYRRAMAAVKNGVYLTAPQQLGGAAVNLAAARTVLSIGAPLLEGWGTPGSVLAARAGFRLIQAEPIESHTAALADLWLRIKPGSGRALALGLTAILEGKAGPITPAQAAAETGLAESQIADLAGELAHNGPALILAGDDLPEALALNRLTGAWGTALIARTEAPVPDAWKKAATPTGLASIPDGSIRALLVDESLPGDYIPWNAIAPKLVPDNPVVVAFAWSRNGYGRHAQFTLPAAVYPELTGDAPAAIDSPSAAFRISTPLIPAPAGMVDPAAFVAKAAGMDAAAALRERADAIHKAGRGTLFTCADAKSTPVKEVKPEDFWKALNEGGCWIDAAGKPSAPVGSSEGWQAKESAPQEASELPLVVALTDLPGASGLVSPLLSKLYQESNLRLGRNRAALNAASAAAAGVGEGAHAVLQTALGKFPIEVTISASVPPGVVEVGASPEILDICGAFSRARVAQS